jgi:hypothetical protein
LFYTFEGIPAGNTPVHGKKMTLAWNTAFSLHILTVHCRGGDTMIPALLVKIALLIIMVVSIYRAVHHRHWLDVLFYLSIVLVALHYYLSHFGSFLGIFP